MHLGTHFTFTANRYPNQVAIVQGNRRYTYEQLDKEINRVAYSLQKLGLGKQDRVMVLLKNRIETVIIYWAVQKLGAIFTPINLRLAPDDIQHCVIDVEAKFIVFETTSAHLIKNTKFEERPILISIHEGQGDITYSELRDRGSETFTPASINEDDISVILYTSGTSGKPKGVPRSHKNEYASSMAHIVQCHYQNLDKTLGAVQIYHTMGIRSLLAMVLLNGTYVISPDFDPDEYLEMIDEEKITCLYLTPTMYHDLVYSKKAKIYTFNDLNTLVYAGAPMSFDLIKKCYEVFKPKHFINHYGSTEIYTFTTCSNIMEKPGCAGKPGLHQNIRLVVPGKNRKPSPESLVPHGEVGEIIVDMQSYEAFKGYWNRPDATRKAIREGWYYTGDLGYIDEEEDLFVVGRVDEMILSGGENIHPQDIASVIMEHNQVDEVVVVGEEDKRWGQMVVAYVVVKDPQVTAQELDQFCKEHKKLSNFMRPRKYVFIPKIPKTSAGKIMYRKLNSHDSEDT
ncbi:2-furoate---CoA ligase [Evansella vedderi]|uniref:2-furoate---CoA ligase n=1 Tax=Evansella vedderi TaxID=38282 RepID=A0ABT9ZQ69_9BACI|nr:class I adenylate-forming enzyme family protein [Evansella vedderi]MDQ0253387.1 2-furoate---CoA ligase [Evansella vedderi]